jgi:hypothetical protein
VSQYLLPEQAWAVIKDVISGIKDSVSTEELRDLIIAVEVYVDKVCMLISESAVASHNSYHGILPLVTYWFTVRFCP